MNVWAAMLGVAERLGLAARLQTVQAYYTIAGRDLERELAPMMASEGVGLMVWSPLAGGLLSGRYDRDRQGEAGSRRTGFDFPPVDQERGWACVEAMRAIADARDVSVAQGALAWLLHQPHVTSVIVGAKRLDQFDDNIGATQVTLTAEELTALDEVSRLPPEYPGWMLERQGSHRAQQLAEADRRGHARGMAG